MSARDEGPVYYREIQKNAYLKRIPDEPPGKLRPLGNKKIPLKPMWTMFCVHNGRTPFLEQYPEADSPATLSHKPVWRACLRTARHVTASVKPRGDEYDFLIDTDNGPVRMLAPDWESMQDWVTTLRSKLHELKIVSKGENVYCAPPVPVVVTPRAAARDPTSPLPPTPPVPPDRVPGIELIPATRPDPEPTQPSQEATQATQVSQAAQPTLPEPAQSEPVDISQWDQTPQPGTSQIRSEPRHSVAKICGQNIALDDSLFKRSNDVTDSDEEFFAEIDRISDSVENLNFNDEHRQTVMVNTEVENDASCNVEATQSEPQATNITVIQVSNKGPPHTAIPVLGPETNVFNFNFDETTSETSQTPNFINIVNTETEATDAYGTVFDKSDYGHLSLTTTVNVTDVQNEGWYERLCMASTSEKSPTDRLGRLKSLEKSRKSSLPNLETESTYEYLFSNHNGTVTNSARNLTNAETRAQDNVTNTRNTTVTNVTNAESATNLRLDNVNTARNLVSPRLEELNSRNVTVDLMPNVSNSTQVVSVNGDSEVNRSHSVQVVSDTDRTVGVERSHSHNAYDSPRRPRDCLLRRACEPRIKCDKVEPQQAKPIWKRGLTELSLLTRLRGIGQKRHDSPTRHNGDTNDRNVVSPVKVVHRSRPEGRMDTSRRRSNSLSNNNGSCGLMSLRAAQAQALRAEQRRAAPLVAAISTREPPIFVDYNDQLWVAWWGVSGARCGGRSGDRVRGLRGLQPRSAGHAKALLKGAHIVDILFQRVPLGKIYVVSKLDQEMLGIKLDSECNITGVEPDSPASRAGIPPQGKWAVTEVNNRPLNLIKGGEEEMNRMSLHGTEASVLIQPSPLVKKLRQAIKSNKNILTLR